MNFRKTLTLVLLCFVIAFNAQSQNRFENSDCEQPATIILFRTFSPISYLFSYKLFFGDSLLGRVKTHDVIIVETFSESASFHATAKAPSLNADRRSNFQKKKSIKYPFSLQPGQVYFVKCGYLNEDIFNYPRQPTIRLIKKEELRKYLRKGFIERKVKAYLYDDWLTEKDIKRYTKKK
ncbi:MAG: hypothetical protein KF845_06695 [Cyclobacteriaceae bacterium]|nr:hypothetical protein [Cyclobacteriaceae bacterium]